MIWINNNKVHNVFSIKIIMFHKIRILRKLNKIWIIIRIKISLLYQEVILDLIKIANYSNKIFHITIHNDLVIIPQMKKKFNKF